jgi:hypothetical protein
MIVYGDPQFTVSAAGFVSGLREQVRHTEITSIDELRALLVRTGQLEQAIADSVPDRMDLHAPSARVTDCAADAFYRLFKTRADGCWHKPVVSEIESLLGSITRDARALPPLTIKVPEGFAFYTLFPEQYCVAADKWLEEIGSCKRTAVIGIRSIGTTLSAVVAAALRLAGCPVRRFTTRPFGPPHERRAMIHPEQVADAEFALVVDEGPGLSGSSMAAVASAITEAGLPRERIVFLPAHDQLPGPFSSPAVQQWWSTTRRYVVPVGEVRWRGHSLLQLLADRTRETFSDEVRALHDVRDGKWRRFAYRQESDWPTSFQRFERAKYLFELADGRRVLWKFHGLHKPAQPMEGRRPSRSHQAGARIQRVQVLDRCCGFEGSAWIEGVRLRTTDVDDALLRSLAGYISEVAEESLSPCESRTAFERLAEMAFWNTKKSLGSSAAETVAECSEQVSPNADAEALSYGDGRLPPWEFVRSEDGTILKTDNSGHDCDHTVIGRQSLLWDAAGLLVEWNLNEERTRTFVEQFRGAAGVQCDESALRFFRIAYAAFRLGMAEMCVTTSDERERGRLLDASQFYRGALSRFLKAGVEEPRCGQ